MERRETDLTTDELAAAGRRTTHDPDDGAIRGTGAVRPQDPDSGSQPDEGTDGPQQNPKPAQAEAAASTAVGDAAASTADTNEPLLAADETAGFAGRWERVQAEFVDRPRQAVENADRLVAELMQHLARLFAREREGLEQQWSRQGEASTEDLRVALQRYRSFFRRLLST